VVHPTTDRTQGRVLFKSMLDASCAYSPQFSLTEALTGVAQSKLETLLAWSHILVEPSPRINSGFGLVGKDRLKLQLWSTARVSRSSPTGT
jgi:hypothetical protein